MNLRAYLDKQPWGFRAKFAETLKISQAYLYQLERGMRPISPEKSVEIERKTGGDVPCEETCPSVDWAYIRANDKSAKSRKQACKA